MKPTHGLFGYFTSLIESYQKVLNPRKDQIELLQRFVSDKESVLKHAGERYLWDKYQEEEAKKKEDNPGTLKQQMAGGVAQDQDVKMED